MSALVGIMTLTTTDVAAYGGVLVNARGQVLLTNALKGSGGYSWTFARGVPKKGESPEQTALRRVREETGYRAEIITPIPLEFRLQEVGTIADGQMPLPGIVAPKTRFFLMGPIRSRRDF